MLFAGVFVLGEVLTLLHVVVWAGIPAVFIAVGLYLSVRKNRSRTILVLFFFFLAGILRTRQVMGNIEQTEALELDGVSVQVTGNVASIQEKTNWTVLVLEKCRLDADAAKQDFVRHAPFRLQVYLPKEQGNVKIGMFLEVKGELSAMESARNPGQWDERVYYLGQQICYRMFAKQTDIRDGTYRIAEDGLYRARRYLCRVLERTANPEDVGLFEAVLLGERKNLEEETYALYQRNGIGHLLAISGLHLTLIGAALYRILRKCGCSFRLSAIAGGVFVCCYALMAGGSVSAKRAAVMLILGFLAACPGRTYDMLSGISLAALIILWENPYQIMQSGFQFSFAAVLGIGGVYPVLAGRFAKSPSVVQAFLAGISVQAAMLPVLLYHNFAFSPYSLLLNLAAVPLMTYVVLSGVLGAGLGIFSLTAARIALGTGHLIIWLYEQMCRFTERMPLAVVVTGRPEIWQIVLYITVFSVLLLGFGKSSGTAEKSGIRAWMCLAVFCIMAPLMLCVPPQRGLEVTFLDVGQGDGICLQSGGKTALVDGGSTDVKELGKYRLEPFLQSRAVTVIEHAFVSHADEDHISGLRYLLGKDSSTKVKNLYLPLAAKEDDAALELAGLAEKRGCLVQWMKAGDRCRMGDLEILCLYPAEEDNFEDRNAQSLVLMVSQGEFRLLLTGDTGQEQELEMLERVRVRRELGDAYLLKVAHHGSRYSSGAQWLEVLKPEVAIISCGKDNRYGHPHEETVERLHEAGSEIITTQDGGAIIVRSDGDNIIISAVARKHKGSASQLDGG